MTELPAAWQQMAAARQRQQQRVTDSHRMDRRGWTRQQWINDARRLFHEQDGSVLSLLNGHVSAMLAELDARPPLGQQQPVPCPKLVYPDIDPRDAYPLPCTHVAGHRGTCQPAQVTP